MTMAYTHLTSNFYMFYQASHEHLISHVLPMLVRAYDDTDARMQEEVLKKTVLLVKQLGVQVIGKCMAILIILVCISLVLLRTPFACQFGYSCVSFAVANSYYVVVI